MASREIAGLTVEVNEEGYLTDPGQWTEAMADVLAAEQDIDALTEGHWKIIRFLQADFKDKGVVPTIRRLKKEGIPTKELYDLFPGGPLKKATYIAGLPKPASCV